MATTQDQCSLKPLEEAREAGLNAAIAELSEALIAPAPIDDIAFLVLQHAKRLTASPFGFVGYVDPETGHLICPTLSRDIWDQCQIPEKQAVFKRCRGLLAWPLDNRQPALANDAQLDPRRSGTPPGHIPIERFLGAPAVIGQRLVGQVAVANASAAYSQEDLRRVERLAGLFALAVQRRWMEDALREERDLVSAILDTAGALVVVLDPQGRIVRFNRACEDTTGYRLEEVLGQHIWDLFLLPEELDAVRDVFAELQGGRFPNAHENTWVTRDGRQRRIAWSNTALLDEAGAVRYVIGTGIDITEQERAQREYRVVLETAIDGLWICDTQGHFLEVNQAACQMLGYGHDELLAMSVPDVEVAETPEQVACHIRLVMERGWDRFESCLRRKDGTVVEIGASAACLDAAGGRFFVFVRDIGERKRAEQLRSEQARQLAVAEERSRLARELHDSITQSLYSLTLLADGWRRLAAAGRLGDIEQPLAEVGEIAQQALKEMRLMVYELRPPALEEVGLEGALQQRLAAVEQRAGVQTQFVAEGVPDLSPDLEDGLYRIAVEALNNALKHSGATSVSVSLRAREAPIELTVSDNGRGFDPVSHQGGLGIEGMRTRAWRLGGVLTIVSAPGQGTQVSIRI